MGLNKVVLAVLMLNCVVSTVSAHSPIGQTQSPFLSMSTGFFFDNGNGPFEAVDGFAMYGDHPHVLGGQPTTMQALGTTWRDLVVTSGVQTIGTARTITIEMVTASRQAIFTPAAISPLYLPENGWYRFTVFHGSFVDPLVNSTVRYTTTFLNAAGSDFTPNSFTSNPGTGGVLSSGQQFFSRTSPAGPNWFFPGLSITPAGFRFVMEYQIVPSSGTLLVLAPLLTMGVRRRRVPAA